MCSECGKEYHDISLKIQGITEDNKNSKYLKAIESIGNVLEIETLVKAKATGNKSPGTDSYEEIIKENPKYSQEWELVPKAFKQLEEEYYKKQMSVLKQVTAGIIRFTQNDLKKSKDDLKPFKVNGKIIYDNKSGKPLTVKQWETIRKNITDYLQEYFVANGYQLAEESAVIQGMLSALQNEGYDENKIDLKDLKRTDSFEKWLKDERLTSKWYDEMYNVFSDTAEYVVNMSDTVKKDISQVLRDGLKERKSDWMLEQEIRELSKDDGKWSKDWGRIAKTEIASIRSDMQIADILEISDGVPVYLEGAGNPNACKLCKRDIIGKKFRVLEAKPKKGFNDEIASDSIWIGKRSIGYGAKVKRGAIPRHPFCACWWITWVPGFED